MAKRVFTFLSPTLACCALAFVTSPAFGQPEVMAWGNISGIRVDGQLMELGSSLCVAHPEWTAVTRTAQERQATSYARTGKLQTVKLQMQGRRPVPPRAPPPAAPSAPAWTLSATQSVEEIGPGKAKIDVEYAAPQPADIAGAYFCLELPAAHYSAGAVELIEPDAGFPAKVSLAPRAPEQNEYVRTKASGARFTSPRRQVEILFNEPAEVIVRDDHAADNYNLQVFFGVLPAKPEAGAMAKKTFTVTAPGEIERRPVQLTLDATRPGQVFDGFGGNFRLQNSRTDPAVIQHNLDNLRVAWGRVEMPWQLWHPVEDEDPLATAAPANSTRESTPPWKWRESWRGKACW